MFTIPSSYRDNYEDYITIPVIKKFVNANHICKLTQSRDFLLSEIEKYASIDKKNEEQVLNWLDDILQEGIRELYLYNYEMEQGIKTLMSSVCSAQKYLDIYVSNDSNGNICGNTYDKDFKLIKATAYDSESRIKLVFLFCRKLITYDKNANYSKIIEYPVAAEYYADTKWLIVKAKPKSNLYEYMENFTIDKSKSTSYDGQIEEVKKEISKILNFIQSDKRLVENILKNKVFNLLDNFSKTPQPIRDILYENDELIKQTSMLIKVAANAPERQISNVEDDIRIILEKYLSINWKNKEDFMSDRIAFPVKLIATDDEESKVEQESRAREPLQTKEIFFDNKKRLYANQKCDGVEFQWKRHSTGFFDNAYFNVSFVIKKGKCIIKFREYTEMEDFRDVLFTIVGIK